MGIDKPRCELYGRDALAWDNRHKTHKPIPLPNDEQRRAMAEEAAFRADRCQGAQSEDG